MSKCLFADDNVKIDKKGSLVVAGVGIKFLSHLTLEAKAHIEQADQVLYLVNNPAMKEWIKKKTQELFPSIIFMKNII